MKSVTHNPFSSEFCQLQIKNFSLTKVPVEHSFFVNPNSEKEIDVNLCLVVHNGYIAFLKLFPRKLFQIEFHEH